MRVSTFLADRRALRIKLVMPDNVILKDLAEHSVANNEVDAARQQQLLYYLRVLGAGECRELLERFVELAYTKISCVEELFMYMVTARLYCLNNFCFRGDASRNLAAFAAHVKRYCQHELTVTSNVNSFINFIGINDCTRAQQDWQMAELRRRPGGIVDYSDFDTTDAEERRADLLHRLVALPVSLAKKAHDFKKSVIAFFGAVCPSQTSNGDDDDDDDLFGGEPSAKRTDVDWGSLLTNVLRHFLAFAESTLATDDKFGGRLLVEMARSLIEQLRYKTSVVGVYPATEGLDYSFAFFTTITVAEEECSSLKLSVGEPTDIANFKQFVDLFASTTRGAVDDDGVLFAPIIEAQCEKDPSHGDYELLVRTNTRVQSRNSFDLAQISTRDVVHQNGGDNPHLTFGNVCRIRNDVSRRLLRHYYGVTSRLRAHTHQLAQRETSIPDLTAFLEKVVAVKRFSRDDGSGVDLFLPVFNLWLFIGDLTDVIVQLDFFGDCSDVHVARSDSEHYCFDLLPSDAFTAAAMSRQRIDILLQNNLARVLYALFVSESMPVLTAAEETNAVVNGGRDADDNCVSARVALMRSMKRVDTYGEPLSLELLNVIVELYCGTLALNALDHTDRVFSNNRIVDCTLPNHNAGDMQNITRALGAVLTRTAPTVQERMGSRADVDVESLEPIKLNIRSRSGDLINGHRDALTAMMAALREYKGNLYPRCEFHKEIGSGDGPSMDAMAQIVDNYLAHEGGIAKFDETLGCIRLRSDEEMRRAAWAKPPCAVREGTHPETTAMVVCRVCHNLTPTTAAAEDDKDRDPWTSFSDCSTLLGIGFSYCDKSECGKRMSFSDSAVYNRRAGTPHGACFLVNKVAAGSLFLGTLSALISLHGNRMFRLVDPFLLSTLYGLPIGSRLTAHFLQLGEPYLEQFADAGDISQSFVMRYEESLRALSVMMKQSFAQQRATALGTRLAMFHSSALSVASCAAFGGTYVQIRSMLHDGAVSDDVFRCAVLAQLQFAEVDNASVVSLMTLATRLCSRLSPEMIAAGEEVCTLLNSGSACFIKFSEFWEKLATEMLAVARTQYREARENDPHAAFQAPKLLVEFKDALQLIVSTAAADQSRANLVRFLLDATRSELEAFQFSITNEKTPPLSLLLHFSNVAQTTRRLNFLRQQLEPRFAFIEENGGFDYSSIWAPRIGILFHDIGVLSNLLKAFCGDGAPPPSQQTGIIVYEKFLGHPMHSDPGTLSSVSTCTRSLLLVSGLSLQEVRRHMHWLREAQGRYLLS
jgi:hypothetical protein